MAEIGALGLGTAVERLAALGLSALFVVGFSTVFICPQHARRRAL
jgi:hypothetical protein